MTTPDVDTLVTDHMPLARRLAASFTRRCELPLYGDDFESAACWGLWNAAETFNAALCPSFKLHAVVRIRGKMRNFLRELFGQRGRVPKKMVLPTVPLDERDAACEAAPLAFVESEAFEARVAVLPPRHRAIVCAMYADGLTGQEAGQRLGIPQTTVSYTHKRALARLRGRCGGCYVHHGGF